MTGSNQHSRYRDAISLVLQRILYDEAITETEIVAAKDGLSNLVEQLETARANLHSYEGIDADLEIARSASSGLETALEQSLDREEDQKEQLKDAAALLRSHVHSLSEKETREQYPDSLATKTFEWLARYDEGQASWPEPGRYPIEFGNDLSLRPGDSA